MWISSLYFQYASLIYVILLAIIYFTKKRISNKETTIYSYLVIASIVGVGLDIATTYLAYVDVSNMLLNPLCKLYLVYLLVWIYLLGVYIFYISEIDNKKLLKFLIKIYSFLSAFLAFITMIIPLYNFSENGVIYTYGPGANVLYISVAINIVIFLAVLFVNIKKINIKKYYPVFAFIILIIAAALIQKTNPQVLLVTSISVFITFLMYFTIENPDVKMIEQLNIAREQAEKANSAKSDFLSSMSHEIRTPLNAIVGFSQILLDGNLSEESKEEVKDIIMASDNLLEIVNGVLDISKIEANKLEIIESEYNFKKIYNDLVKLTKVRIGEKPIVLRANLDPTIPDTLYGDHTRVKQIILNLLTNAAKYTDEGYVTFTASSVKKDGVCRLIISVEDTGRGIKTEKIDKLFTKFERLEADRNTTIEGTGLGLAIAKKLLELMNGRIIVQSEYGEGSKFTVAIDQKIVYKESVKEEKEQIEIKEFSDKKVLVVDDNKINLKVASKFLQAYKVDITLVESGFECIGLINKGTKFDLILMDDMMPGMSGVETYKKLKEIPNFNIPTIALTANAISGMKERYLSEGFNDYLSKPIDKGELNRIIQEYLNN